MSDVVFCHNRNIQINKFGGVCVGALGGTTVAMESLKPWILDTLKVGEFLEKKVGIAKCSDKDRYNKKSGRDIAKSRMKLVKLTVSRIVQDDLGTRVTLIDPSGAVFLFIKYKLANEIFFTDYNE